MSPSKQEEQVIKNYSRNTLYLSKGQTAKELKNSIVNRKSESVLKKEEQQSQSIMQKYEYLLNRQHTNQSVEQVYNKYVSLGQKKQLKRTQTNANPAKSLKNTMQVQLRSSEKPII